TEELRVAPTGARRLLDRRSAAPGLAHRAPWLGRVDRALELGHAAQTHASRARAGLAGPRSSRARMAQLRAQLGSLSPAAASRRYLPLGRARRRESGLLRRSHR